MKRKHWILGGSIVVLGVIIAIVLLTTPKPTHQESDKTDGQEQTVQKDEITEQNAGDKSSDAQTENVHQNETVKKDSEQTTDSNTGITDSETNKTTGETSSETTTDKTEEKDEEDKIELPFVPFN